MNVKLFFYNNPSDRRGGYCDRRAIFVNTFHHNSSEDIKSTIVHEMAHVMLHFTRKHYTPSEKEYQARMVEYNYSKNIRVKRAFLYYKKALLGDNFNLLPLQNEVRSNYKAIVSASLELMHEYGL